MIAHLLLLSSEISVRVLLAGSSGWKERAHLSSVVRLGFPKLVKWMCFVSKASFWDSGSVLGCCLGIHCLVYK